MAHFDLSTKKSFTYMEVLISVFLIGVLFTPLLSIFASSMSLSNQTLERSYALDIARSEMEKVANLAYDEAHLRTGEPLQVRMVKRGNISFRMSREIDPASDPLRVEIRVGLEKGSALVSLVTLIEDNK